MEADVILPGPMTHKAVNIGLLLANSYATLSECTGTFMPHLLINRCRISNWGLPSVYGANRSRHIYLYDGINLGGYTFKERRDVCDVRNAVYELRNFGVEGAEYRSRLADIHFQYPRILSAAGKPVSGTMSRNTISTTLLIKGPCSGVRRDGDASQDREPAAATAALEQF
ncbi:MAG: hypothetical protein R2932_19730 [Caldilineaceae bacterium]